MDLPTERLFDGLQVRLVAVGGDLRRPEHARPEFLREREGRRRRALRDAVDGHEPRPRVERDPRVLVPVLGGMQTLDEMALLAADEAPHLVELQRVAVEVAHRRVQDAATPLPDTQEKIRDRRARDLGQPYRRTQGDALNESGHHPYARPHGKHLHTPVAFPRRDAYARGCATLRRPILPVLPAPSRG